jgi:hypothetical protein
MAVDGRDQRACERCDPLVRRVVQRSSDLANHNRGQFAALFMIALGEFGIGQPVLVDRGPQVCVVPRNRAKPK